VNIKLKTKLETSEIEFKHIRNCEVNLRINLNLNV